jgi:hypothetical protein
VSKETIGRERSKRGREGVGRECEEERRSE